MLWVVWARAYQGRHDARRWRHMLNSPLPFRLPFLPLHLAVCYDRLTDSLACLSGPTLAVGLFASLVPIKPDAYHFASLLGCLMGKHYGVIGDLRDVFLGNIPHVLHSEAISTHVCAVAVLPPTGRLICLGVTKSGHEFVCVAVTVGLRRWSLKYNVLLRLTLALRRT